MVPYKFAQSLWLVVGLATSDAAVLYSSGSADYTPSSAVQTTGQSLWYGDNIEWYQPVEVPSGETWTISSVSTVFAGESADRWLLSVRTDMQTGGGSYVDGRHMPVTVGAATGNTINGQAAYYLTGEITEEPSVTVPLVLEGGSTYWVAFYPENTLDAAWTTLATGTDGINNTSSATTWRRVYNDYENRGTRDVVLTLGGTVAVVPEPAGAMLAGMGAFVLLLRRRSR